MKIDTKITERDKKLLLFLTILLLGLGFGVCLIAPLASQIKKEYQSWQEQQRLQQENEEKIKGLSALQATHKQLEEDLGKAMEGFYTPMASHEIDQLLTDQILKGGLFPQQLEITMPLERDQDESKVSEERYPGISSAQVKLRVSGSLRKLQSFADALMKESPSIRVTSLRFAHESEDDVENQVEMDVVLDIYMVKV